MFNIPEKYYIGKDIALKDFIPKNLKPNDKKKIRDCVKSARLEYQIVGEDIPSVNNEEYHCETIQFYDISVYDIKQSGYIAKTYQSIIKSLCIIRLHDIGKELYSFALKRLSQINEEQVIVTDSMLTDTYPAVLDHEGKNKLYKLLDYELIKNKTDKVNFYTEMYCKAYILNNNKAYSKSQELLDGNAWYDTIRMNRMLTYYQEMVNAKKSLKNANTNVEKININKEIKEYIELLDKEL